MKKEDKKERKTKLDLRVIAIVVVVALIVLLYFSPSEEVPFIDILSKRTTTTTSPVTHQPGKCGDLQIEINSMQEAISYYRFGIQRPAMENSKYLIIDMTVTNKAETTKDFSGYRVELVAGSESYIPLRFNEIEKITLIDNSIVDYSCVELPLAYISRFEMNAGSSMTGCKIFQTLKGVESEFLYLYDLEGLKCTIQIT